MLHGSPIIESRWGDMVGMGDMGDLAGIKTPFEGPVDFIGQDLTSPLDKQQFKRRQKPPLH